MRQTRYILSILYVDIYAIIFKDLLNVIKLDFSSFFFFFHLNSKHFIRDTFYISENSN